MIHVGGNMIHVGDIMSTLSGGGGGDVQFIRVFNIT